MGETLARGAARPPRLPLNGQSLCPLVAAGGKSLNGTLVSTEAAFTTAVATLRTPNGHNPALASRYTTPIKWSTFDTKFATVRVHISKDRPSAETSRTRPVHRRRPAGGAAPRARHTAGGLISPLALLHPPRPPLQTATTPLADQQEGNHQETLAEASKLANKPLVVISCGAGSVKDSAVQDKTLATYWQSHWELYKHFYAFSRYLWLRNITRMELYNEPGAGAACAAQHAQHACAGRCQARPPESRPSPMIHGPSPAPTQTSTTTSSTPTAPSRRPHGSTP